jgi:hypothetical protein
LKSSVADVMRKLQGCQRAGCVSGQRPVRIPVVVVWASPVKDHEPANMVFEAERTCASCVATMTLDDVLTGDTRSAIAASFEQAGKPAPCWATAQLSWRSIQAAKAARG